MAEARTLSHTDVYRSTQTAMRVTRLGTICRQGPSTRPDRVSIDVPATFLTPASRRCPACGKRIKRVLRTANDKRRWDADDWRRYRCRGTTCGWRGLLPAKPATTSREERRKPQARAATLTRAGRAGALWLLMAGVAWSGVLALQYLMGL
jgi:hypothetical protein